MGTSSSKSSDGASPHAWKGSAPSGVSHDLVETLQTNHETDASRSQLVELHIQTRVAEELRKLQAKEAAALKTAHEKLAADGASSEAGSGPSRHEVSKEVEALRAKLESRKQPRELPESVEAARSDVIKCLRDNDRRPLDCWKEVERFKEEVKRLEKGWVDKVIG